MKKSKLIGTKDFYHRVLMVAVPIMIQNGITNFVGMLDNIMVGQVGTDQMSGVAIVNQLMFVYNLMVFGGLAGIGIFTAQFAGKGDEKGLRYTMRIKIVMALVLTAGAALLFFNGGSSLIGMWLKGDSAAGDAAATMAAAEGYLRVMLVGMVPFAATQVLSGTLRETGETIVPMKAGGVAGLVNLVGNYILIYGKFGAPVLGVVGAAIATNISRFVEFLFVLVWLLRHLEKNRYMEGLFRGFYVPGDLALRIVIRAFPLLLNETLWSLGNTVMSQQYSLRGLDVVAAFNISSTICNVFNIAFIAMGEAISILLGQELGAGRLKEVKDDAYRLAAFTVFLCLISGTGLFLVAPFFPLIYNTTETVREFAAGLIRISAVCMPLYAYENASYFTLRSGGKTWITFFFDCGFVWAVSLPLATVLIHFTALPILPLYLAVQAVEILKVAVGFVLVRRGKWIHDLTVY